MAIRPDAFRIIISKDQKIDNFLAELSCGSINPVTQVVSTCVITCCLPDQEGDNL